VVLTFNNSQGSQFFINGVCNVNSSIYSCGFNGVNQSIQTIQLNVVNTTCAQTQTSCLANLSNSSQCLNCNNVNVVCPDNSVIGSQCSSLFDNNPYNEFLTNNVGCLVNSGFLQWFNALNSTLTQSICGAHTGLIATAKGFPSQLTGETLNIYNWNNTNIIISSFNNALIPQSSLNNVQCSVFVYYPIELGPYLSLYYSSDVNNYLQMDVNQYIFNNDSFFNTLYNGNPPLLPNSSISYDGSFCEGYYNNYSFVIPINITPTITTTFEQLGICSDNTTLLACSNNKPLYCEKLGTMNVLVNNSGLCGCLNGFTANTSDNTCYLTPTAWSSYLSGGGAIILIVLSLAGVFLLRMIFGREATEKVYRDKHNKED
jgi:hypothetical protein